jgi:hypothetical protein
LDGDGDGVDLVVVGAVGEGCEFVEEVGDPVGGRWLMGVFNRMCRMKRMSFDRRRYLGAGAFETILSILFILYE